MYKDLSGKIAVITGAGGHLGRAVSKRLHSENVRLAVLDHNQESLKSLVEETGGNSTSVLTRSIDLTRKSEVDTCVEQVAMTWGTVGIVVNIAGGFKTGLGYGQRRPARHAGYPSQQAGHARRGLSQLGVARERGGPHCISGVRFGA